MISEHHDMSDDLTRSCAAAMIWLRWGSAPQMVTNSLVPTLSATWLCISWLEFLCTVIHAKSQSLTRFFGCSWVWWELLSKGKLDLTLLPTAQSHVCFGGRCCTLCRLGASWMCARLFRCDGWLFHWKIDVISNFQPKKATKKSSKSPLSFCVDSYVMLCHLSVSVFFFKLSWVMSAVSLAHSHVKTVQWHPLQGWFAATRVEHSAFAIRGGPRGLGKVQPR